MFLRGLATTMTKFAIACQRLTTRPAHEHTLAIVAGTLAVTFVNIFGSMLAAAWDQGIARGDSTRSLAKLKRRANKP